MINGTLFKKELKSNYILLLIFIGVLSMYGVMIVAMFDPKLGESLTMMMESMPQIFAAFNMTDAGTTLLEHVTNYLYGMLLIAFPGVFIIILSNRLVARYVDNGSMAYLLAAPWKRSRIITTQAVFLVLGLLALTVYVTVLTIISGEAMFPGELDIPGFLRVNAGLFGVLIFFGGVCFLASCIFNESKYATGIGAGVVVYSILVQMLSRIGDKFEFLEYITPLTLYDIDGLIAIDTTAIFQCAVLYVTGLACIGVGILHFSRRNLPI